MSEGPFFPPLMEGLYAVAGDPMQVACDKARDGVDAGLLVWVVSPETLSAALVLAPDEPLGTAMAALPACAVGLQNALGALAPPETAVHLGWAGEVRLNGAVAGRMQVASDQTDPDAQPNWLVVGFDLALAPAPEAETEPGQAPERTSLAAEGCAEIDPVHLLEAWSRHTLIWLNALEEDGGRARLHGEWTGLAWGIGKEVIAPEVGTFLGIDEHFGLLLKSGDQTRLIPLTAHLSEA